jgi:hypothetical protein
MVLTLKGVDRQLYMRAKWLDTEHAGAMACQRIWHSRDRAAADARDNAVDHRTRCAAVHMGAAQTQIPAVISREIVFPVPTGAVM